MATLLNITRTDLKNTFDSFLSQNGLDSPVFDSLIANFTESYLLNEFEEKENPVTRKKPTADQSILLNFEATIYSVGGVANIKIEAKTIEEAQLIADDNCKTIGEWSIVREI